MGLSVSIARWRLTGRALASRACLGGTPSWKGSLSPSITAEYEGSGGNFRVSILHR
jgi:hypothetical protein